MNANFARLVLEVDGADFGRFLSAQSKTEGLEFAGTEAVRTVVGGWTAQFSRDSPRRLIVRGLGG